MSDHNDIIEIAVGIDLGTTNSCAAVYLNQKIKILDNKEGDRITPSYIYYANKNKIIVGHYAKKWANKKPKYGIYEVKRLIGRKFDDPKVQDNLQYLSYVVNDIDNDPVVVLEQAQEQITVTPVELSTAILQKIKDDIQNKLGKGQGLKAVITVPAYFNIAQRKATLEAATKAGFIVLKLLNEPTAVALRFSLEDEGLSNGYFLVYDLGGGTFDVAILKRTENKVEIVGVDGDSHLGGHDFDNLLLDHACQIITETYEINPKLDKRSLRRLNKECEEAKKELSNSDKTEISLEGFTLNQEHIEIQITRAQFEEMADGLFNKTIKIVGNCLRSCNLSKTEIKKVILAGGSTRIPKIQELIEDFFGEEKVNKFLHPDECVAEGAAIQAAMLSSNPHQKIDAINITDVIPLSLGTRDVAHSMNFMIRRNTPIPVSVTQYRRTMTAGQKGMLFEIYEGERIDCRKNRHLGQFVINDLTPGPPGQCEVLVVMNVDQNGILTVTASEKQKDNIKELQIQYSRGHRSDGEVKNALKDAEDGREEDEKFLRFVKLKLHLMDYCERARYNFENKCLECLYHKTFDFLVTTFDKARDMEIEDEDKVEELIELAESKCEFLINQHGFVFMPVLEK